VANEDLGVLSRNNKAFAVWMRKLNRTAIKEFGYRVGSLCEAATRMGSVEEEDWFDFFNDGMTPREALIDDLRNH
jgi:hypothetical protein